MEKQTTVKEWIEKQPSPELSGFVHDDSGVFKIPFSMMHHILKEEKISAFKAGEENAKPYLKKVKKVNFNWFYTTGEEEGEDCSSYVVGEKNVTRIEYHEAQFSGDKHYCDVFYKDKTSSRIFNLNYIVFEQVES